MPMNFGMMLKMDTCLRIKQMKEIHIKVIISILMILYLIEAIMIFFVSSDIIHELLKSIVFVPSAYIIIRNFKRKYSDIKSFALSIVISLIMAAFVFTHDKTNVIINILGVGFSCIVLLIIIKLCNKINANIF